jgi:glycosyltransferase involved in cell wall biosynthesis
LPNGFLLSIGHFEKRKNYSRLIDALALLNRQGRNLHLVIVGNESGESQVIKKKIARSGLSGHVTVLHGISDSEVQCLYRLAGLFVFPSYYEGFGIPVLEAMASACPMVLSDIPVFREITGNQGAFFPFDDVPAMAKAIAAVLDSADERRRLIALGHQRVKDFHFSAIAEKLQALYRTLLDRQRGIRP